MKIGTKSVLFGAHLWWLHPLFVAVAWTKLYGFPLDWRLWLCFYVHDLGYWGKVNMDGDEGETHVELGARIVHQLCDKPKIMVDYLQAEDLEAAVRQGWSLRLVNGDKWKVTKTFRDKTWHDFCLYHSRFYSKRDGVHYSKLCVADKLAICLEPYWLYLPRVILTGEIHEYMGLAKKRGQNDQKYTGMNLSTQSRREWFQSMVKYIRAWVEEHRDMKEDSWTPEAVHEND